MRANLTTRDYEQLSAYIDGQLAPGEQRKLEERLRARPELQVALDEMQRTRALLRQAPRRRAPRNFTLTPAMVGEQRRKPAPWAGWFPALSFTSALAALALVVTIVLQFAPPGSTSQTIAMQPAAGTLAAEAPAAEAPMMKKMEQPAGGAESGGAESGAAEPEAADPFSLQAPETEPALEAAPPAATDGPAVLPEYEATAQAFGEPTPAPEEPSAAMAAPEEASQPPTENLTATAPPVITWDNSGAAVPPQANGMGGGPGAGGMGGGGGADGPSLGPLMGPPPAPDNTRGLGGGAPDGAAPETMEIQGTPASGETPAAEEAPAEPEGTPVAAVPADPAANSTGPILGVPEAGEGGQITDKKAILGDADGARNAAPADAAAQPEAGAEIARADAAQQRGPFGLPLWALTVIQVALALLAIAAGVAAYLFRLRNKRS